MDMSDAAAAARRHRMIQEAAYFRAQRRGFAGGDPVADWLEAEAEVDRMLGAGGAAGGDSGRLGTIEQFEAQVAAFDEELRRLMSRAREMGTEVRAELEAELEKLRPLQEGAEDKLAELRERSDEAWDQMKKGVHSARHELNAVLNAIAKRWR